MAGIAAACGNNGIGMTGVTWNSKIMPALSQFSAKNTQRAQAILYAFENGADIITNSWASTKYSKLLQDVIEKAYFGGCVILASAGNQATEANSQIPAAYPQVITVGALEGNDHKAGFSNYGNKIDIIAPGVNMFSTLDNFYGYKSGTSMATPLVAGVVALILSYNLDRYEAGLTDHLYTNEEVRQILRTTAKDLVTPLPTGEFYPGYDSYSGFGRVDAYQGIKAKTSAEVKFMSPYANLMTKNLDFKQIKSYRKGWTIVNGIIDINGIANCQSFKAFIIEVGYGENPKEWKFVLESSIPVTGAANDTILIKDFDTNNLPNGPCVLKLTVYNNDHISWEDRLQLDVARALISNIPTHHLELKKPAVLQFEPYDIRGFAYCKKFESYHLEYGLGDSPDAWHIASGKKYHQVKPELPSDQGGKLLFEQYDFTRLPDGILSLKLVVNSSQLEPSSTRIIFENDSSNFPNQDKFPINVINNYGVPVTVDLHGNGQKSIILSSLSKRAAYSASGEMLYELNNYNTHYGVPAIGQVIGDQTKEIVVKSIGYYNADGSKIFPEKSQIIEVLDANGLPHPDFEPIVLPIKGDDSYHLEALTEVFSSAVLSDLNNDGYDEIIFGTFKDNEGALYVYEKNGNPLNGWDGGKKTLSPIYLTPVVGNLDFDDDMEIVVRDAQNYIYVFDSNGNLQWSVLEHGVYTKNRNLALADLTGDGFLEIISSTAYPAGITVWHYDGTELWHYHTPNASQNGLAVANVMDNSDLEIIGFFKADDIQWLTILDSQGKILTKKKNKKILYRGPVVGNINGQHGQEIFAAIMTWAGPPFNKM